MNVLGLLFSLYKGKKEKNSIKKRSDHNPSMLACASVGRNSGGGLYDSAWLGGRALGAGMN